MSAESSPTPGLSASLNPAECALVLIDLQVGSVGSIRSRPPHQLRDNAIALTAIARLHGIPVVLTAGRKPGVGGVFLPELRLMTSGHVYIERTAAAAFDDPAFAQAIAALKRRTLIMAGVATDIGLLYAVLGARALGYEALVALDASGAADPEGGELAKLRMIQAGAAPSGWASIAAGLMRDFAGPTALETLAIISERMDSAPNPF